MLVRFTVTNFQSFKNESEFTMVASENMKHRNHIFLCNKIRVLKGAFIYGANASGKSNFIRSIAFAQKLITKGFDNVDYKNKFYRLDSEYADHPGVFQFDIFTKGCFYSYGFAISYKNGMLEEEWLYDVTDFKKERCIFGRKRKADGTFEIESEIKFNNKDDENRFNVYKKDAESPNMSQTFFLKDVASRSLDSDSYKAFTDVYTWFGKLIIIFPDSRYIGGMSQLIDEDISKNNMGNLLREFDTGIEGISKNELNIDKVMNSIEEQEATKIGMLSSPSKEGSCSILLRNRRSLMEIVNNPNDKIHLYELRFNHGNREDLFEYGDESDGTKRLINLLPLFQLMEAHSDLVIFVDELDRNFHSELTKQFVSSYFKLAENKNVQLIVTTHETSLLNLDFVRQDEVWFIDRKTEVGSTLYSLNAFPDCTNTEKEYLLGRYGGVPVFNQIMNIKEV